MLDAKYLIRFDDICPTMDWQKWQPVEQTLLAAGVKPLLSVVPDNRDQELHAGPAHPDFWAKVREWQSWGWSIGLHGYQHIYSSDSAGLLGRHGRSEFAGLPEKLQREKLERGLEIFRREGVHAEAFIAPGHSFDATTVQLLGQLGVPCLSDGYALHPFCRDGMLWVPQQLGWFHKMPVGTWTVCLHVNPWTERRFHRFYYDVAAFRGSIVSLGEIQVLYRHRLRGVSDRLFHNFYRTVRGLKGRLVTEVPCTSPLS